MGQKNRTPASLDPREENVKQAGPEMERNIGAPDPTLPELLGAAVEAEGALTELPSTNSIRGKMCKMAI